jgi:capsular exopolysaccharide synthesis family protein
MSQHPAAIDDHVVTLVRRSSPEAEDYNTLRYALEKAGGEAGLRVVAVTSPTVGDGKTTTAVNLAGVLAHRRDARVLLIDADLRRPSVAPILGHAADAGQAGLVDAILDSRLTLDQVATRLSGFNLWVLHAGRPSDDPFELLRTPRAGELLQEARRRYDMVVLDTSPLLLVPDTQILENWIDGFVLVVAAHRTPRKLVGEALHLLNPSKLIGVVFNNDDRPLSGYKSRYGYGYPSSRGRGATDMM